MVFNLTLSPPKNGASQHQHFLSEV